MTAYKELQSRLLSDPKRWLVTGGAGFIGSHLVETLLSLDQKVVCLDNLSAGSLRNIDAVLKLVSTEQAGRFSMIEGDLGDPASCAKAIDGVDHVLHQGALGSVPLSIENPEEAHHSNATGTFNLFVAAKNSGIRRIVYASTSAVYGDDPALPKQEEMRRQLLTPYAATKAVAEDYASSFAASYEMEFAGLRYFNVFGPRQDPGGAYAAVIPLWIRALLSGESVFINGDGENTRDFIYVEDVVQANLLAATVDSLFEPARVFNIAIGGKTSLNALFDGIKSSLEAVKPSTPIPAPVYREFRAGDIRHSYADFSRAREELGFQPKFTVTEGLQHAMAWYVQNLLPS